MLFALCHIVIGYVNVSMLVSQINNQYFIEIPDPPRYTSLQVLNMRQGIPAPLRRKSTHETRTLQSAVAEETR